MPATPQQEALARTEQVAAAHDAAPQVRLVAGPGTGKSRTIGERVLWLIHQGVRPDHIFAVSFTRASARSLENDINDHLARNNFGHVTGIRVSTLHSLALGALKRGGLLRRYTVSPMVLGDDELDFFFDPEASSSLGAKKRRCRDIRTAFEAYLQTGQWPPTHLGPTPPITQQEQTAFEAFHHQRTRLYSCVLPGEVVRDCLEAARFGGFDPVGLLSIEHLIVDEYQDLNPCDIEFIDWLANHGVSVFVAGDDDQSIYSFRYAAPSGIQQFTARHAAASSHDLTQCFRCTPEVLAPASRLIGAFAAPGRIPKNLQSVFANSAPQVPGVALGWKFQSAAAEAQAIAESCRNLIASGVQADKIFILISNRQLQQDLLVRHLDMAGVPTDQGTLDYPETDSGRMVLAVLRIVRDGDDYVAHRVLLGSLSGVGPGTCNKIAEKTINTPQLSFHDLFHHPLPHGVFTAGETKALTRAAMLVQTISQWTGSDTIQQRSGDISNVLANQSAEAIAEWQAFAATVPPDMSLGELCEYLWSPSEEQRRQVIEAVLLRLGVQPVASQKSSRVRLMTMHGAKGLTGHVVFIPGLEDELLPGGRRNPYTGDVFEAARLLYVSITRARVACILSWAEWRSEYGQNRHHQFSQFIPSLQVPFSPTGGTIGPKDAATIMSQITSL